MGDDGDRMCVFFRGPVPPAPMVSIDGREDTGLDPSISCISYEADDRLRRSIDGLSNDGRRAATGSSSKDASNGSLGNLIGLMLRCSWDGDVERKREFVLSTERLGFCNRFDILLFVPELEPDASFDSVLR